MAGPWTLEGLFDRLRSSLDFDPSWPDGDWPVRWGFVPAGFEIAVGAVLTQNTRWENVERSLERLAEANLTSPEAILEADGRLEEAIRPSGFYRRKTATLRRLAALWVRSGARIPPRGELIDVAGVGPETADAISLYAAGRAEFVADAYARRLVVRLGLERPERVTYSKIKARFERELRRDPALYRAFHALIVQHGKRFCRKRPHCPGCPLSDQCPSSTSEG